MADTDTPVQRLRRRFKQLKDEVDQDWRTHWYELSQYLLPRKGRYLSSDDVAQADNRGVKLNDKIINGSVCDAVRVLAAGMQGGLTSPARPWFRLGLEDEELAEFAPVRRWLHEVRQRMLQVFQRSNFYGSIHSVYEELGVFGTNSMLIEEDFKSVIRFRPFTAGEFYIALGPDYRPDSLYRRFSLTARQLIKEFGEDNCSQTVVECFAGNQGEKRFEVIHVIQPNWQADPASLGAQQPFESIYFEELGDTDKFLRRGGYSTLPFVAPRWNVTASDVYGRSPGMDALGDCKMLQKMETKGLKALDKMIDPPMNAPSSMLRHGNPTVLPGGVNFVDIQQGGQTFGPAYQINPNFQDMEFKIQRIEERIKRFFFNDMFLTILMQQKQMTAREVAERHEEKLLMLGPVLERLQSELLNPIIERTYTIMTSFGLIPTPPEEIRDREFKVEYISLLAQAQKMVGTASVEQFAGLVGNIAAVVPQITDKVDWDEVVDQYGDMVGVPPKVVRSDDEVEQLRAARAEQQQQMMQAEQGAQMAQSAKVLADAKLGQNSALDALVGQSPTV